MISFVVPYTDDQIEVDSNRRAVMLFRNAWNRQSSGYPDETHSFAELLADPARLVRLMQMLGPGDAAELRSQVGSTDPAAEKH